MKTAVKFLVVFALIFSLFGVANASTNPFVDVESEHWAYDAVKQLNSRGIVSGYEDGMFKGNKAATRYEMASVVARMLAFVDANKATKEDVELLKKLAVEFNEELSLLGVKNDQLDTRLQVLEENIGGWKFAGKFVFNADFANNDNSSYNTRNNSTFKFDTAELYISKFIDEKTSFHSILASDKDNKTDLSNLYWKNFYVSVVLPFDVHTKIGRFSIDWAKYYVDNDPWFLNNEKDGFLFSKNLNTNFSFAAYVSQQNFDDEHMSDVIDGASDVMTYGAKLGFDSEKFSIDAQYHMWDFKDVNGNGTDDDISAFAVTAHYNIYKSVKVFGEYWKQNLDGSWVFDNVDNPNAYKFGFFVGQDILKVTDLWVEYSKWDKGFILQNDPYALYEADVVFALGRVNYAFENDTTAWFAKLEQKWNDKWSTFGRYAFVEQDVSNQKVTNWSVGVKHYYTSNLSFELSYDNLSYDNVAKEDDNLIRFKTVLNF